MNFCNTNIWRVTSALTKCERGSDGPAEGTAPERGNDYRVQSRGGKGLLNYRVEKFGKVANIAAVTEENDVIMISTDGIIIRMPVDQISTFQRPAKGVKVMRVNEGEKLATISVVDRFEEDEFDAENEEIESEEAEQTEE